MKCPRCIQRNGNHPLVILGKVLAVTALCTALWFFAKAFIITDDTASGVIREVPQTQPQRLPLPTPIPDRANDPLLRR